MHPADFLLYHINFGIKATKVKHGRMTRIGYMEQMTSSGRKWTFAQPVNSSWASPKRTFGESAKMSAIGPKTTLARSRILMFVRHIAVYMCSVIIGSSAIAQDDGFKFLFDGETLSGWEGNAQTFRVVDGAIVAGTTEAPIELDEFLCTDEQFGDFELELEARMSDGQIGGVQFRGQRIPDSTQVGGYQADMGFIPGEYIPMLSAVKDVDEGRLYPLWGSLLDEYRPDRSRYPDPNAPYWLLAVADRAAVEGVLNRGSWNRINITAIGRSISIRLNGALTSDYVEQDTVPQSGLICVQVHSGPPSLAAYRNIKIRRLPR